MKLIVAGTRTWSDYKVVETTLNRFPHPVDEIISGKCKTGADKLGEQWAAENLIFCRAFPAAWAAIGDKAGLYRNQSMVDYAKPDGALVAFWDGQSRGTADVIRRARAANILVWVVNPKGEIAAYMPQAEFEL